MFLISSLPFLVTTVEEAELLYKVWPSPSSRRVFEENDQVLLYASPWPPSGIWAQDAMDSTAALAGLTIRTYDKNGTTALNELGAAAIRLSWADVVPSISTGAIDAVLTSAEVACRAASGALRYIHRDLQLRHPAKLRTHFEGDLRQSQRRATGSCPCRCRRNA